MCSAVGVCDDVPHDVVCEGMDDSLCDGVDGGVCGSEGSGKVERLIFSW